MSCLAFVHANLRTSGKNNNHFSAITYFCNHDQTVRDVLLVFFFFFLVITLQVPNVDKYRLTWNLFENGGF